MDMREYVIKAVLDALDKHLLSEKTMPQKIRIVTEYPSTTQTLTVNFLHED